MLVGSGFKHSRGERGERVRWQVCEVGRNYMARLTANCVAECAQWGEERVPRIDNNSDDGTVHATRAAQK